MTRVRLGTVVVVLIPLLLVPFAIGAEATVSAEATLTGSGTSYRMAVRNTGTEAIRCFDLLLVDGVQPTSLAGESTGGPAGVITRVGTVQGRGVVSMQGTAAAPAIPASRTVHVDFRTNIPIRVNAGGEIRYSSTCQQGSDQIGRATGPSLPKCTCMSLTARIDPATLGFARDRPDVVELTGQIAWAMSCSGGTGKCTGSLSLRPSNNAKGLAVRFHLPDKGRVRCVGPCGGNTFRKSKFSLVAGPKLARPNRGTRVRAFEIRLGRGCDPLGAKPVKFRIVFSRDGGIDRERSDLNGNGKRDGTE